MSLSGSNLVQINLLTQSGNLFATMDQLSTMNQKGDHVGLGELRG